MSIIQRKTFFPFAILVLAMVLLGVLLHQYSGRLEGYIATQSQEYLVEVTAQQAQTLGVLVAGERRSLEDLALGVSEAVALHDVEQSRRILGSPSIVKHYAGLGIITSEASSYISLGYQHRNLASFLMNEGIHEKHGVTFLPDSILPGGGLFLFYCPIIIQEREVGILYALHGNERLLSMAQSSMAGQGGRSMLITQSGDILSPMAADPLIRTENFFKAAQQPGFGMSFSVGAMKEQMRMGKAGQAQYFEGETHYVLTFSPVPGTAWYQVLLVPESLQARFSQGLMQSALLFLGACLLVLAACFMWFILGQRKGKKELENQLQYSLTLINNLPGGVLCCKNDAQFTILDQSPGVLSLTGYSTEELEALFQKHFIEMVYYEDRDSLFHQVETQLAEGKTKIVMQYRIVCADGSLKWILDSSQIVENAGEPFMCCLLFDNTTKVEDDARERMDAQRYRILFEFSDSILYEFDMHSGALTCSPKYLEKFGYLPPVTNFPQSLIDESIVYSHDVLKFISLNERIFDGERDAEALIRMRKSDGSHLWCHVHQVGLYDANNYCIKIVGKITDVDADTRAMQKLRSDIQRDPFTHLYNKVATQELVEQHFLNSPTGTQAALCIIDVDNFKKINDNLGHAMGDSVLLDLSKCLQQLFRSSDIVGRIGGDEFVVFLKHISTIDVVMEKMAVINRMFHRSYGSGDISIGISASIGVAIFPDDGNTYHDLYSNADTALYHSKITKNRYTLYNSGLLGETSKKKAHSEILAPSVHSDEADIPDAKLPVLTLLPTEVSEDEGVDYEASEK